MKAGHYLGIAAATLTGMSLVCVALTVFVDPYRMFGTPPINHLTTLKPRIYQQIELSKVRQLDRTAPRTLLLGNSRTQNGLDPQSDIWPASFLPVFNAGIAGRDLFTESRMLDEALASAPVTTVILQVDFPDFLSSPTTTDTDRPLSQNELRLKVDRDGRPNPQRLPQLLQDMASTTLTIDTLFDDLQTLMDQNPSTSVTVTPSGFDPLHEYSSDVRVVGYSGLFAQKNMAYRAQYAKVPHPDFRQPYQIDAFRALERILQTTRKRGVRLIIFIPPYHADLLKIIRDNGLWPTFENWKRAVVHVVAAQEHGGHEIELIDFSGYSRETMEAVPGPGDLKSQMHWYWEAGHFKSALGEVMLERMISGVGDFGQSLTPDTLEFALARDHDGPPRNPTGGDD